MHFFITYFSLFTAMPTSKSILITGCSSGIGYRSAQVLRECGYRVFATARKEEDVKRLQEEGFESLQLDLQCSDSIHQTVKEVQTRCEGKLYALFNNGAYGQPGAVEDLSRAVLREQFETNLFGTHELTCLVIPMMREQGEGRIIQNSSLLGYVSLPYRGAYNASKYALEGLTDTLRLELQGTGIEVSLIEPGPITSRFRANAMAMYHRNIRKENSYHRQTYEGLEARLNKEGPAAPFTLSEDAVVKVLIHALEHRRPRVKYPVTFPAYLFAWCRRLLSNRALDSLLLRISKGENR